jgi:hypothetical protein
MTIMVTRTTMTTLPITDTRSALRRAELALAAERLRAPAAQANSARNARAQVGRHARWAPLREAAWRLVAPLLSSGARVAIVGAGNADTVPLERIAERAGEVTLIDLDGPAIRTARRCQPRRLRRRIGIVEHDVTCGAADVIATAAANGEVPDGPTIVERPLPGAPYDLVYGDLFYSQLLYPALVDLDVPDARTAAFVDRYGPMLTRAVVSRLHVSADEAGRVLHIHDPIAWWPGHPHTVTLELILATAEHDPAAALSLAATGSGPHQTDPRRAIRSLSIPIGDTALWHWPFAPGVDYLVCASVTGCGRGDGGAERAALRRPLRIPQARFAARTRTRMSTRLELPASRSGAAPDGLVPGTSRSRIWADGPCYV